MNQTLRRLPDSELAVMQAVWSCGDGADRQAIQSAMNRQPPLAVTTLLTLLTRLEEKGFLRIEKTGRRSRYLPLISRREYQAAQSGSLFRGLFRGSVSAFASALCDSGLTREEREELSRLLREDRL